MDDSIVQQMARKLVLKEDEIEGVQAPDKLWDNLRDSFKLALVGRILTK